MSRNSAKPLTPQSAKQSGIVLIVLAVLFIVAATVAAVKSGSVRMRSTERALGTVVSVDTHYVRSGYSRHIEYEAVIKFSTGEKTGSIKSEWSKKPIYVGDEMLVNYDPDDPSVGYAASLPPESGAGGFLFGILFALLGVYYLKRSKSMLISGDYAGDEQSAEF